MHLPIIFKYPVHMSTISEDFIMCSCIMHQCTSEYSTLSTHALQNLRKSTYTYSIAPLKAASTSHHISKYFPAQSTLTLNIQYYSHTPHRLLTLSLPQHSKHGWYASLKISIVQEHTQACTLCNKDMGFYPSSILFTFHYLAFVSHDSFPYLSVGSHVTIYLLISFKPPLCILCIRNSVIPHSPLEV